MKKLLLAFTLIGFIATSSFAAPTLIINDSGIAFCDHKDCDKKDCKHDKKSADSKKACTKDKKACCAKTTADNKKACCTKGTAKTCDKSKASTTSDAKPADKKEDKESK